jgi:hypothetical protein
VKTLDVASNPLIATLGPPARKSDRVALPAGISEGDFPRRKSAQGVGFNQRCVHPLFGGVITKKEHGPGDILDEELPRRGRGSGRSVFR